MTEKRFAGEFDNQYSGVYDNGKQLSNFEVIILLNKLAGENKKLKKENNELKKFIQSDKAIKDILPLLHKELREIIEEECETYRKEKNTVAIRTLQDFAESLGI